MDVRLSAVTRILVIALCQIHFVKRANERRNGTHARQSAPAARSNNRDLKLYGLDDGQTT